VLPVVLRSELLRVALKLEPGFQQPPPERAERREVMVQAHRRPELRCGQPVLPADRSALALSVCQLSQPLAAQA